MENSGGLVTDMSTLAKQGFSRRIIQMIATAWKGIRLTGKYLRKNRRPFPPKGIAEEGYFKQVQGPVTIQYPQEKIPVPASGRYRLFMETDDCIGCDKCARICPVDCITIETFRADGDLGKTSDGTVKRLHLPAFDIDMAKCMFCGLCTTVCPTECLYMTPVYDYSEFDRDNFLYHFGAYSPEEEKRIRKETEASLAEKAKSKQKPEPVKSETDAGSPSSPEEKSTIKKPLFKKPVIGIAKPPEEKTEEIKKTEEDPVQPPPIKKPLMKKPVIPPPKKEDEA